VWLDRVIVYRVSFVDLLCVTVCGYNEFSYPFWQYFALIMLDQHCFIKRHAVCTNVGSLVFENNCVECFIFLRTSLISPPILYHWLDQICTFTSAIGSFEVQDLNFGSVTNQIFFLKSLRQYVPLYSSQEPNICRFTDKSITIMFIYKCWHAHYSPKNSALLQIHCIEIPFIMWVFSK
jgi:hypothetical protein